MGKDRDDLLKLAQSFQASGDHLAAIGPTDADSPATRDRRTAFLLRLAAMRFEPLPTMQHTFLIEEMLAVGHETRLHYQNPSRAQELLVLAAQALVDHRP